MGAGTLFYSLLQVKNEAVRENPDLPAIQGLSEDAIKILYLASLAPSGHNTQPWMITIKEPDRWGIGSDEARWLPAVDPDNREMMLSVGAFIETMAAAAGTQGYNAEFDIVAKDNVSSEIAEVKFSKRGSVGGPCREIKERRTIRKNLLKNPVKEEDIKYLIGNNKHEVFYYPRTSRAGTYLSQATLLANRTQAYREDAQRELAEWIRWSERDAREHRNGLTPESMEMQGIARWYAKHFLSKQDVLSKTFREETVKLVEEYVQHCAGWLVIKSDNSTVTRLIKAGRVLQSIWLRACERAIAFHPMTQVLEEYPWRTQLARELNLTGDIQFVIRVGYSNEYPKPVSLRMPMAALLAKKQDAILCKTR